MALTQADLDGFTGTERYYRHWSRRLLYTEGVKFLAEEAGAWWLVDLVASYQRDRRITGNERLREFQLWTLTVANHEGLVQLRSDSDKPVILSQAIEFTDFPLDSVKLYLESNDDPESPGNPQSVLLLPSEH